MHADVSIFLKSPLCINSVSQSCRLRVFFCVFFTEGRVEVWVPSGRSKPKKEGGVVSLLCCCLVVVAASVVLLISEWGHSHYGGPPPSSPVATTSPLPRCIRILPPPALLTPGHRPTAPGRPGESRGRDGDDPCQKHPSSPHFLSLTFSLIVCLPLCSALRARPGQRDSRR